MDTQRFQRVGRLNPEPAWKEIPYWQEGSAAVAEITYTPFGGKRSYRLIVRRVEPTAGSQLWLRGLNYSYFAFITDRRATCWS